MIPRQDIHEAFYLPFTWFKTGAQRSSSTLKGCAEGFHYMIVPGEDSSERYQHWMTRIREFVQNAPLHISPSKVEWLQDHNRQQQMSAMIVALEKMNSHIIGELFGNRTPFLYFEECSLEEVDDDIDSVCYEFWKSTPSFDADAYYHGYHQGAGNTRIWEDIIEIVDRFMAANVRKVYRYVPEEVVDDPFKSNHNALRTSYSFFINQEDKLLIAVQFAKIPNDVLPVVREMEDFAERRASERATLIRRRQERATQSLLRTGTVAIDSGRGQQDLRERRHQDIRAGRGGGQVGEGQVGRGGGQVGRGGVQRRPKPPRIKLGLPNKNKRKLTPEEEESEAWLAELLG